MAQEITSASSKMSVVLVLIKSADVAVSQMP